VHKLKIKAVFNRRNKLGDSIIAPIHIDLYLGGNNPIRKFIHTGIEVRTEEWDSKLGIVFSKVKDSHHLNKLIQDKITAIRDFEYTMLTKGETMTSTQLENFLLGFETGNYSFLEFYKKEINPSLKWENRTN